MQTPTLKLLTLNVTENCNATCLYCHWWKRNKLDPPLKDLTAAIDDAIEVGLRGVRLSGGEPVLRPDLAELINYIKSKGLISMVCTSANTDSGQIIRLVDAGLDIISISIDTLDPILFKEIRGYSIEKVKKNIETLAKIRSKGFEIILSIVLTKINIDGLTNLLNFALKFDILVNITPYQCGGSGNRNSTKRLHFKKQDRYQLSSLMTKIIEATTNGLRLLNSDKYLCQSVDFLINRAIPADHVCKTGYSSAIRMANGDVKLCHSLDPLQADSLSKVWLSPEADILRGKMMRLDCPLCWLSCHADQRRFVAHRHGRQEIWEVL